MKAIQRELGQKDDKIAEADEYREKIIALEVDEELEEKMLKEVERLEKMPAAAAEISVIRTYLDWLVSLPWNTSTEDSVDIKDAEEVLNEDHYGLTKVKERILEFLAVRKLSGRIKGPILCLVGPPGVGKTSLARSVARAMNRKFVRISLGGVRDEAEIRGHRRTYVGSMPGRIIQGMRQAGSKNPVFLLDEIDKMNADFRGDPSSALLEVLDPEQNNSFSDHYIELPFDLSKVLFITTANTLYNIPRPLLDRMETVTIPGYTEEEKLNIATKYLLPKQIKQHGLQSIDLQVSEKAIRNTINNYTRESGVRNLERQIANMCRKVAKRIVEEKIKKVNIKPSNLKKYLGNPYYHYEMANQKDEVGVVRGLAWTIVGGDTLSIEVTPMKGSGKLVLTGQLGDVMKESARAGVSYIRSRAEEFKIDSEFHNNLDIHIHIPEGATPKDGPSAGITMATAVISALTEIPVDKDVAMTGEITLRGRVLPVGGIKEKVLAARRAGIKKVLLPMENKRDLDDVPSNVKSKMQFVFVEHMDEVLDHALKRGKKDEN